tara:strand:- start:330 stop:461 length:132 start_codon:yes stop_codon:yes gene_type:complete
MMALKVKAKMLEVEGERAKRKRAILEDSGDEVREMATDGYVHY